jgi:hypothetical protein
VFKIAQWGSFFVVKIAHFGVLICGGFSCRTASINRNRKICGSSLRPPQLAASLDATTTHPQATRPPPAAARSNCSLHPRTDVLRRSCWRTASRSSCSLIWSCRSGGGDARAHRRRWTHGGGCSHEEHRGGPAGAAVVLLAGIFGNQ